MKKKCLIFIVSLVLLVFSVAPAFAEGAETLTTITIKPGAQLAAITELTQIAEIAALRIQTMEDGYGALAIMLNQTDAVTALFHVDEGGAYVQSQAFGVTPLYFSWEDLKTMMMQQMESNPEMLAGSTMLNADMFQAMMDGSMSDEQAMNLMGIDEELLTFINDVQSAQTIETGAFTLNGSDSADQKAVTVLTKDELKRAVGLTVVRKQIASQMLMSSPTMTQEEVDAVVDAEISQMQQSIDEGNMNVTVTQYTNNGEFVAMQVVFGGVVDAVEGGASFTVTKTTVDEAKYYQMTFRVYEGETDYLNEQGSLYISDTFKSGNITINSFDQEPVFLADFNCDTFNPEETTGEIAFTVYNTGESGQESVLLSFIAARSDAAKDTSFSLYTHSGSMEDLKAAMVDSSLISVNFHTVTQPDSGFFAALQGATPEASVQMLQMTDEERNAYMQAVQQSMMMTVMTVIQNLPPDISNALMQSMGGSSY